MNNAPYTPYNSNPKPRSFVGSPIFRLILLSGGLLLFVLLCGIGASLGIVGLISGVGLSNDKIGIPTETSEVTLEEGASVGSLALDFSLVDAHSGETVKLSDYRGRPVWINFWATWCPPCREEMPQMQKLYEEYSDRHLAILGIDVQETSEEVQNYTTDGGYKWTFVIDETGEVVDDYLVTGLPTHLFLDEEGVIRAMLVGPIGDADVRQYLEKIVPLATSPYFSTSRLYPIVTTSPP